MTGIWSRPSPTPFLNECVRRNYEASRGIADDALSNEANIPLLMIPSATPLIRSAEDDKVVTAIVEEKDATEEQRAIKEVNSGAYCFSAKFLQDALTKIDCNNSQHEYYLPDTVKVAFSQGEKVIACLCDDPNLVLGANDRAGL